MGGGFLGKLAYELKPVYKLKLKTVLRFTVQPHKNQQLQLSHLSQREALIPQIPTDSTDLL